jgi:hypothetical protein
MNCLQDHLNLRLAGHQFQTKNSDHHLCELLLNISIPTCLIKINKVTATFGHHS